MIVAASCSTGQQPQGTPVEPQNGQTAPAQPSNGDEPAVDPMGGGGLDGAGLVQQRCTVCHSLDRVNAASKDKAGWETTVSRMIRNGAKVTEQEKAAIVQYLAGRG